MEKEFGLIGQESGKNKSKNVNLCFFYLHKLIARQTEKERIGFDSIDIQYMIIMRFSHIHFYTYLGGLLKQTIILYICILLLFIHLISACSYSFSLNLHDNTFRTKRKEYQIFFSLVITHTLIEMQSAIHSFIHLFFFAVVCNRINTKQKKKEKYK